MNWLTLSFVVLMVSVESPPLEDQVSRRSSPQFGVRAEPSTTLRSREGTSNHSTTFTMTFTHPPHDPLDHPSVPVLSDITVTHVPKSLIGPV
jgi:hypothetical protein